MASLIEWSRDADKSIESPLEIRDRKAAAAEARELERMKVGSEAFYKQQLGLSEMYDRKSEDADKQRLKQAMAGAPQLNQFLPQGVNDDQAIKDGMAKYNQANTQYWMQNYPEYADDMTKASDRLRQQAQAPMPSTMETKASAEAKQATAVANYHTAGGDAAGRGIEVSEAELQMARGIMKEGRSWVHKQRGVPPEETNTLAVEAKAQMMRDQMAGKPPKTYTEYLREAKARIYGGQAPALPAETSASPAMPTPPAPTAGSAGGAAPVRRAINLRNP